MRSKFQCPFVIMSWNCRTESRDDFEFDSKGLGRRARVFLGLCASRDRGGSLCSSRVAGSVFLEPECSFSDTDGRGRSSVD